jgi:hypothetical protein
VARSGDERSALPAAVVESRNNPCFVVRDHNGQTLAYISRRRGSQPKHRLTASAGRSAGPAASD